MRIFKKYFKAAGKNKAQVVAEYAIFIAVVFAVFAAMQIYLRRGVQAHLKGAADYPMSAVDTSGNHIFATGQYEPDIESKKETLSFTKANEVMNNNGVTKRHTELSTDMSGDSAAGG